MTRSAITVGSIDLSAHAGAVALVTGGAGFIGRRLCDLLHRSGWIVETASRRPKGPETARRHWPVDLANPVATRKLVQSTSPDYVFHLASHVSALPDLDLVQSTFQSNLHTTVNLLHAVATTKCRRFILTGSQIEPEVRSPDAVPNAPYSASKWASSDYVRMFHALYQLPGAIARVFMVYGPEQNESKLIPYVIRSLAKGETPKIASGRRQGDWVYVDDVALGLALMAVAPGIAGHTIDLGSGSLISTGCIVEKIYALMEAKVRPVFGAIPDRPMEPTVQARVEHTRHLLAWAPGTAMEEGLRRTIDYYRRGRGEIPATPDHPVRPAAASDTRDDRRASRATGQGSPDTQQSALITSETKR